MHSLPLDVMTLLARGTENGAPPFGVATHRLGVAGLLSIAVKVTLARASGVVMREIGWLEPFERDGQIGCAGDLEAGQIRVERDLGNLHDRAHEQYVIWVPGGHCEKHFGGSEAGCTRKPGKLIRSILPAWAVGFVFVGDPVTQAVRQFRVPDGWPMQKTAVTKRPKRVERQPRR